MVSRQSREIKHILELDNLCLIALSDCCVFDDDDHLFYCLTLPLPPPPPPLLIPFLPLYPVPSIDPFLDPVAWQELGLFDYPQIVKYPMCLHNVFSAMNSNKYKDIDAVASDIRLVWNNCMTYNQDGSPFHTLASQLSVKFEADFAKIKVKADRKAAQKDAVDTSVLQVRD